MKSAIISLFITGIICLFSDILVCFDSGINTNELVPSEFYLSQNYPNPFKETTTIRYIVAYKTWVQITVYNSEGIEIEALVNEEKPPGSHRPISWNRANLSNGVYFYRMRAGNFIETKKMVALR